MKKMTWFAGIIILISGLFPIIALADDAATANQQQWNKNHPRRAQVNKRLNNQDQRIQQGVNSGKLTQQQANQLRAEDQAIRQQERAMASQNGGHITKQEQRMLNQEENQVSKQIYQEKHPGQN